MHISINDATGLFTAKYWDNEKNMFIPIINYGDTYSLSENIDYSASLYMKGNVFILKINNIEMIKVYHPITDCNVTFGFLGESETIVSNVTVFSHKPKVFVIMQFSDEYNEIYETIIKPCCEGKNLEVIRADESYSNGFIIGEILNNIKESSVIIADITPDNPNVYYEVGYAHALDKNAILLCNKTREKLPFDVAGLRTIFYINSIAGHVKIRENLTKHIEGIFTNSGN